MRIKAALSILLNTLLCGCSTIAMQLPSVQNCQHITYQRDFNQVAITADCLVGE